MAKVIAFLVLLLISPAAYAATTHTVGGSAGWTTSIGNWASTQTFVVGDSLRKFIFFISNQKLYVASKISMPMIN